MKEYVDTKETSISPTNLLWGTVFIVWGLLWVFVLSGVIEISSTAVNWFWRLSPLFWVVLGIIIIFHDDSRIEEVKK